MTTRLPRQMEIAADLALLLMEAAIESARRHAAKAPRANRPRRGETLRPGSATPLWNALAQALEAQLSRRGEKARLARVLGLPRQRVHEIIRARHHLPDAERTLLLLAWLHARNNGQDLA